MDAGEVLGALEGRPWLVVDLDAPGMASGLPTPIRFPGVVIGTSRLEVPPGPQPDGVDVALTSASVAPAPWVSCDVEEGVSRLCDGIDRNPLAAVTLAQTLRLGAYVLAPAGLIIESLAYSTLQCGPEFGRWLAARTPRRRPSTPDVGEPSTEGDPVVIAWTGDELTVTLNRPHVHNAYNAAMRDALCEALGLAIADPAISNVHLDGRGPSFCSGGDLDEFGTAHDPVIAHLIRTSRSPATILHQISARLTAHLHGACIGSGIELPAFAGTVVASADVRIRLPEVAMGLIPGAGGTVSIPRRIGAQRTAWVALTGITLDAHTALDWGLIDLVRPST